MPELTAEQKEHLKITHRANLRIDETWQIFNMYLADGKKPAEALELALDAVDVWSSWMSQNEVEPPDIPHPDFGQQMADAMKQVVSQLPKPTAPWPWISGPRSGIDAEFLPAVEHEAEQPSTALPSAESLADQHDPK